MSSKDASNAIERRTLRVILSNGRIAFEGVEGFSIDLKNPELKVGNLYNAVSPRWGSDELYGYGVA